MGSIFIAYLFLSEFVKIIKYSIRQYRIKSSILFEIRWPKAYRVFADRCAKRRKCFSKVRLSSDLVVISWCQNFIYGWFLFTWYNLFIIYLLNKTFLIKKILYFLFFGIV